MPCLIQTQPLGDELQEETEATTGGRLVPNRIEEVCLLGAMDAACFRRFQPNR
jgi:hypothetical protein